MFEQVLLLGLLCVEGVVLDPRGEVVPAADGNGLKCSVSTLAHHVVGRAHIHSTFLAASESTVGGGEVDIGH